MFHRPDSWHITDTQGWPARISSCVKPANVWLKLNAGTRVGNRVVRRICVAQCTAECTVNDTSSFSRSSKDDLRSSQGGDGRRSPSVQRTKLSSLGHPVRWDCRVWFVVYGPLHTRIRFCVVGEQAITSWTQLLQLSWPSELVQLCTVWVSFIMDDSPLLWKPGQVGSGANEIFVRKVILTSRLVSFQISLPVWPRACWS